MKYVAIPLANVHGVLVFFFGDSTTEGEWLWMVCIVIFLAHFVETRISFSRDTA